eukprot:CAMPEP_0173099890 /NCGR_PEP_ID=MMETSP1102-20130122/35828_1 /TAXON_ID=49646 /ORGANISM="Geminigera sp., Strain Caron Lab Isolate" /LENGTH=429 /DNA_ID=CAMNT_0013993129 /DNA_START=222 /DNA_END=1511 /DNA_ORIENTATION=+
MPRKSKKGNKNGGAEGEDAGSLRGALGGFFGTSGGSPGSNGGMFGNVPGMFGNGFGGKQEIVPQEKRSEPFGKASALAAADEEDYDEEDSPRITLQAQAPGAAAGLRLPSPADAAAHAEAERQKWQEQAEAEERAERQRLQAVEEEEKKKAEERKRLIKREQEAREEVDREAKRHSQKKEEVEAAHKKKEVDEQAAAQKADAVKKEKKREQERQEADAQRMENERKQAAAAKNKTPAPTPLSASTADKVNNLLLLHSSKWEVQVSVDDSMAASWVSHVQARTLMQQLRLRLLLTPAGWHPSERPNLTTVVAAGLVELGALEPDQRATFLAAKGGSESVLTVSVLVHETEKANGSILIAMQLTTQLCNDQAEVIAEGLKRLKFVNSAKKSIASSWGSAQKSKDTQIPRSVGTMSAMLTAGLFTWDRLSEE